MDNSSDEIQSVGNLADNPSPKYVLPTIIPGETLVYFVPTDNDATNLQRVVRESSQG